MESEYTPAANLAHEIETVEDRRAIINPGDFRVDLIPFRHQLQAIAAPVRRVGIIGGYGGGKSKAGAWRALRMISANPWRPAYGSTRPRGAIVGPTWRILRQATLAALDSVTPREWVRRRRGPPHNSIEFKNGFVAEFHSALSDIEGQNYTFIWCDEISHHNYSERLLGTLVARVRDPLSPFLGEIFTGLPVAGWVRDFLDHPPTPRSASYGGRWCIMCKTRDNTALSGESLAAISEAVPAGDIQTLMGGEWASPLGAIYREYDARESPLGNITIEQGRTDVPTDLGMDVGEHGAVVFSQSITIEIQGVTGQTTTTNGVLIVDQMLTEAKSVDEVCYEIKLKKPWMIVPGVSRIAVDPTTRRDEKRILKSHFPGVKIIQRDRTESTYHVEDRIRCVRAALKDALGNRRLLFTRSTCTGVKYGISDSLERAHRNERGQRVKDDRRDHIEDALAYIVCEKIPPGSTSQAPKRSGFAARRR